ncbi:MAG: AraC family transcriptional regulator [Burkholderiales bacterium]|nr:AraC family transcriptional regulator [Burkholderiales bacterium]
MGAVVANRQVWVRSGVLAGAVPLLAELGVDADALAADCGLDPEALAQADLPVPGAAVVAFFENAAERSGCEDFGLRLSARQDLSILGPLWMTMRSAMTVRDALQVLAQFFVVHTRGAMVGLEAQADGSLLVSYALSAGVSPRDRQTVELGLALLCQEMRLHCGAGWMPRAALFTHGRPAGLVSHRRVFGPTLQFDQERNAVWIGRESLDVRLSGHSVPTHAMLKKVLVGRLDSATAVAAKVEGAMRALMPFADCSREQVARLAQLSQRTLQRRLAEAGTSFQELRDQVRADIALKYLRQSSLQAAQIAEILGYSEPAAFTRAFRRQHGMTPSAARRGKGP